MGLVYVEDTNTFRLTNVKSVFPTADRLSQCFARSSDGYFGNQKGLKDRLTNFRNYATKFGYLYNSFVFPNIAAAGWRVPSTADWDILIAYLGGPTTAHAALKIKNTIHWAAPQGYGSTNTSNFNAKGGGYRNSTLYDVNQRNVGYYWSTDLIYVSLSSGSGTVTKCTTITTDLGKRTGYSIRLLKNSTSLTDGQVGSYTGNDGKVYQTICIGTQEWLADNLKETKFNTGADILYVNMYNWGSDNTPARCAYWDYDNDTMV